MNDTIICPKCGHEFEVTEALVSKIEKETKEKYATQSMELEEALKIKQTENENLKSEMSNIAQDTKLLFIAEEEKLKTANDTLEKQIQIQRIELEKKHNEELSLIKKELSENKKEESLKIEKIKKDLKAEYLLEQDEEIEKIRSKHASDLKNLAESLSDKMLKENEIFRQVIEKQISDEMKQTKEKEIGEIKSQFEREFTTKQEETIAKVNQEKDLLIEEQNQRLKRTEEQLNKALRQTQQLDNEASGEAFENYIEKRIKHILPLDIVNGISKGSRGADLHIEVMKNGIDRVGSILIECKNTNTWQDKWVRKAIEDRTRADADMVVIVTNAMPSDIKKMGVKEDVFIINSLNYLDVIPILRREIIEISRVQLANVDRYEKIEQLYNYLSSPQFTNLMGHANSATYLMQKQLDTDIRSAELSFKKRRTEIINMRNIFLEVRNSIDAKILTFNGDTTEIDYIEYEQIQVSYKQNIIASPKPKDITKRDNIRVISTKIFNKDFQWIKDREYKDIKNDIYILGEKDEKWATIIKVEH